MLSHARLLGFAFANADFLFEVGADGLILFATGAGKGLVQDSPESLTGKLVDTLFEAADAVRFATSRKRLRSGCRAGPYKLKLAGGVLAEVSMFRLPENGDAISCTMSRADTGAELLTDAKTGLQDRQSFLATAGRIGTEKDALTLVNVPGLPDLCATLTPEHADQLLAGIGASIEGSGAAAAGRLSDTSFAALAAADSDLALSHVVGAVLAEAGLTVPQIEEIAVTLKGSGLSGDQRLLALRYVVEKFTAQGSAGVAGADCGQIFAAMMQETQQRLLAMTKTVNKSDFTLAYQPIADLATGKVSHYEALARFNHQDSTADSVKFIEALGIADAFDLAVVAKVLSMMEADPRTHYEVAFNVSGNTISSPSSFGMLAGILSKNRKLASRLLIEITETAEIDDLEAAGKAVASLRALGFRVGLDDFGAGAASVNYLHAFQVDFVKFDGALIKKIGSSQRDDALLAGLAKLCSELKVLTIAEWIEDEKLAKSARTLGFRYGQGHHFGMPAPNIPYEMAGGSNLKSLGGRG